MDKKKNAKMGKLPSLEGRPEVPNGTAGINSPEIAPPAFNPPVPNRAWTAMRKGMDIDELSDEERRDLYIGHDDLL